MSVGPSRYAAIITYYSPGGTHGVATVVSWTAQGTNGHILGSGSALAAANS
ncbi:MAG: hypothetical protein ACLQFR_00680 [Streptosporangiaceae bacterium]